jgi:hypothetical protein
MKKGFYATCAAFLLAFSLHAQTKTTPLPEDWDASTLTTGTTTQKRSIVREMEKTIDGKKWELRLQNDEVAEVRVNGKSLAKSTWPQYQTQIDDLRAASYALDADSPMSKDSSYQIKDIQLTDGGLTPENKATQNALEDALLNESLIKTRSYKLILTEKSMIVDGKTMSKEVRDRFIDIYYAHAGETRCAGCTFKFQINKK